MPDTPITITGAAGHAGPRCRYRMAACEVVSDLPLRHAGCFATKADVDAPPSLRALAQAEALTAPWKRGGRYLLGNRSRSVLCRASETELQIDIADMARLTLRDNGRCITYGACRSLAGPERLDAELEGAILGPGLLTSLACAGTFSLHASALAMPAGDAVALVGVSGAGKSTLAEAGIPGWTRIADDVLPVTIDRQRAVLLPHYAQFKLAQEQQYPRSAPERVRLSRIYVLAPREGKDARQGVHCAPMAPRDAVLALVRHTIATRIFPPPLLEAHLDFCTRLAATVPVYRLRYPQAREFIPGTLKRVQRSA